MKLYIAARFSEREFAKTIADKLESYGHEVTSSWVYGETGTHAEIALTDFQDMHRAEALLFLTGVTDGGKGIWVEMGIALGQGKPVYVYPGRIEACIFMHLPAIIELPSLEVLPMTSADACPDCQYVHV